MERLKFKDPIKAQAAIAYLISQGWGIDLAAIKNKTGEDLTSEEWLKIANHCLDDALDILAESKIIPIESFSKKEH